MVTAAQSRLLALDRARLARGLGGIGATILVVWMAAVSLAPLRYDAVSVATPMSFVEISPVRRRVLAYLAAGESLARVAAPTDSVAAPEFGALGATWPGRILDPCGLISREALPFLPIPRDQQARIGAGAISVDFVQATNPDWIVALPIFTSASLRTSDWFHQHYRVEGAMALPFVIWESRELVIYRKRDQPLPLSPSYALVDDVGELELVEIADVDEPRLLAVPDQPLVVARKVGDLELAPLAAHHVDQVLIERIAQVMRHRRRRKAEEVAGADFDLLAVDVGHAAPDQDVEELLLEVVAVVRERFLAGRDATDVDAHPLHAGELAERLEMDLGARIQRMLERAFRHRLDLGGSQQHPRVCRHRGPSLLLAV